MNLSATLPGPPDRPATLLIRASGAADHRGVLPGAAAALLRLAPGWSPLQRPGVDALRGPGEVLLLSPSQAQSARADATLDLPGHLLLPGLVNAHTHLDLSALGPLDDARGDFPRFIQHVRAGRPADTPAIRAAVALGADLSLRGGVVAVGDIAGCPAGGPTPAPAEALAQSGLAGVSFLEFFAIGDRAPAAVDRIIRVLEAATTNAGIRVGVQPHAPYSVEPAAYRAILAHAARHGWPTATHLAESPAEREFIAHASGPHRHLLDSLGLWSDRLSREFGQGLTPIGHASAFLGRGQGAPGDGCLLVHCNDTSDTDLPLLAGRQVVYCPRSSEYFDAHRHFGPHRYRDMRAAGIPVCLGTDSILNLPAADIARSGISTLDEARLLARRDHTAAADLIAMITTLGAQALGLDPAEFEFGGVGTPRRMRGLIAVPCGDSGHATLESTLQRGGPARLLFLASA